MTGTAAAFDGLAESYDLELSRCRVDALDASATSF